MSGRLGIETALQLHHPLCRILSYTSPLPNHIPSANPQNPRAAVLSLKRRRPANTITRQSKALSQPPPPPPAPLMADKAPQNDAAAPSGQPSEKSDKSSPPPPPPPPEKPLPGECCGSGCVRCVWDVYYEELEEYNKLYKTDSDPK